jgi:pimeloyl-ACP methyl ester carboxylesterase
MPLFHRTAPAGDGDGWPCSRQSVLPLPLSPRDCNGAGASPVLRHSKPNILLVHGAWDDGSSWDRVTARLQDEGSNVVASQIALTSFADDVAVVQRDLRVFGGPILLVGHSYGGAVITEAAQGASNVTGVVYIAALAPDTGESVAALATDLNVPPLASAADVVPIDLPNLGKNNAPFVILARDKVRQDFCQDCTAAEAALLASTETPLNLSDFATPVVGPPAWKTLPSWYQISAHDNTINPLLEEKMALRMDPSGAHTISLDSSHASMISHARQVASFIERAAGSS